MRAPFDGLWLDIGRPDDYANATRLFQENRARLLPEPPVMPIKNGFHRNHNHTQLTKNSIPRTS